MHSDTKYGLPRQRGFGVIEGLIALAVVGAIVAVVAGIYLSGRNAGADAKQTEWDADKAAQSVAAALRAAGVDAALESERARAQGAEAQAEQSNRLLAEERRRAKRNGTPLAACLPEPLASRGGDEPGGYAGRGIAIPAAPVAGDLFGGALRLRVTYEFVRQYDGAWTGLDGQPLPKALAGDIPADRAATSPYGPEDIIDVHIANAEACSRDRRSLDTLMKRAEAAAAAWDKGSQR